MRNQGYVHDLWGSFVYESKMDFESLFNFFSPNALTIDPLLGMHVGPQGIQSVCKEWYNSYTNITYPTVHLIDSGESHIYFDWNIDNLHLSENETSYSPVRKAGFKGATLMEISEGQVVSIQYRLDSMEKERSLKEQLEIIEQQKSVILEILSWRESLTHIESLVLSCYLTGRSFLYTERLLNLSKKTSQSILDHTLSIIGVRTRKALFDHYTMRQSIHLFYRLFDLQKSAFVLSRLQRVRKGAKSRGS